jgi:hypothetical protein
MRKEAAAVFLRYYPIRAPRGTQKSQENLSGSSYDNELGLRFQERISDVLTVFSSVLPPGDIL